jgi:metallo-beta-lactamase family protein
MEISFHGADRGVTGSCHLVSCAGKKILIDCGMYQGGRELDEENSEPFGFDPKEIDFVLLTHAHLDHCGRLPLLAKRGFRGEIITTSATRELARLVMVDAAHLQEEEAQHREHHSHHRKHQHAAAPLYSIVDAFLALDYFGRVTAYGQPIQLAPGIRATFIDAGHILGSACILLELEENGRQRSVLFSGDLGNSGRPLLRSPAPPPKADMVVMETTYGDRLHKPFQPSVEELYTTITDAFRRGGNVIIPTFALERAQELLYFLHEGVENNRLPRSTRCSWIPRWRYRPPRYSSATRNATNRQPPNCFAKGGILSTCRDCISPAKRRRRSRSIISAAAPSSWRARACARVGAYDTICKIIFRVRNAAYCLSVMRPKVPLRGM